MSCSKIKQLYIGLSGRELATKPAHSAHLYDQGSREMRKYQSALMILLLAGFTHAEPAKQTEPDYAAITQRIRSRIISLQEQHPVLEQLDTAPSPNNADLHLEYEVTWKLDDPTKPHSKLNARHPVYRTDDAVWFHIHFYRGPWKGAAFHRPYVFGNLRVWLRYGYNKDSSVVVSITQVIEEEKKTFEKEYPGLPEKPDERL